MRGHGLVECRIEYSYLRNRRHQFGYCFDTRHVDRIVQRRYIVTFLYFFDDFVCDEHAFVEFFSTVHDPMADSIDFIERLDTPIFFTGEYIQYVLDSRMVLRHTGF